MPIDLDMRQTRCHRPDSFSGFLDAVERQQARSTCWGQQRRHHARGAGVDRPIGSPPNPGSASGVILGSKLAAQRMVPARARHVINVASLAREIYAVGGPYCASKHAVVAFTGPARKRIPFGRREVLGCSRRLSTPSSLRAPVGSKLERRAGRYRRRDRQADCSSKPRVPGSRKQLAR